MIHGAAPERHAHPSNPLASASRAVITFHARWRHFPDDDIDKVRFIHNPDASGNILETRFPDLESHHAPVLVSSRNAREAYTRAWIDGDKEIDARDATVVTFGKSISFGFADDGVPVDDLPSFPHEHDRVSYNRMYWMCEDSLTQKNVSGEKNLTRIPACMNKHVNLESIFLDGTSVSKIENLDKLVNLKHLDLSHTPVSKIEGLEKNVKLTMLDLDTTRVSKIEGLDKNVKLKHLDLTNTPVSRIENLGKNVKLEEIWLHGTSVSKIENLDKLVKLKILGLTHTPVSKIENLDNLVNLEELSLDGTSVSKIEGLEKNVKLKELWLRGTKVTHIENLDNNTKLEKMLLDDSNVSEEEKKAFEATRPGLRVT